jgi:DNA-binding FadR family transcriptional regulator
VTNQDARYPHTGRHGQLVHDLGRAIVRGKLPPGHTMPTEEALVVEFGVGRSALREGVKVLAGKGLVESRTSAGTRVRPRDSWSLLDPDVLRWRFEPSASDRDLAILANFRVAIEPGAARLAAEIGDSKARHEVSAAVARLWATVDTPDEFIEADLEFHRAVFVASSNDLLIYIHDVISDALRSVRPLHTHSIAHNRETLPNHELVAQAIRKGNHRKAEEAMRRIVEVARKDALAEQAITARSTS